MFKRVCEAAMGVEGALEDDTFKLKFVKFQLNDAEG